MERTPIEIMEIILQEGQLEPTSGAGVQVVKANYRADMKGMANAMQAER